MYVWINICRYEALFVGIYVYMYECMFVYVCVYITTPSGLIWLVKFVPYFVSILSYSFVLPCSYHNLHSTIICTDNNHLLLIVIAEEEYGGRVIICHNIPQCGVKITPHCYMSAFTDSCARQVVSAGRKWTPDECQITSPQGHVLRGGSVLCFIYPLDHTL